MPLPGYSRFDGVYVGGARTTQLGVGPRFAALDVRLTARRGVRGTLDVYREDPVSRTGLRLDRQADVPDHLVPRLTIDRTPELSGLRKWALAGGQGVGVEAAAAIGAYRESPSGRKATRENLVIGIHRTLAEAQHGVFGGVAYRRSWYSSGSQFSVWETQVGVRSRPKGSVAGEATFIHRAQHGVTPFEFDDVDIANELRCRAEVEVSRRWRVGATVRYDTQRAEVRDETIALTNKAHCLEYTVKWHRLTGDVGLGVGLVGF